MPHYYMFHKPFGCVTARRDDRYPTVMDYFEELQNDRLSPVGRLDRETTGLLIGRGYSGNTLFTSIFSAQEVLILSPTGVHCAHNI